MVKYIDIKGQIKSGDIIAYSRHDLVSWLVRIATGSKYSHVGVVWIIGRHVMILEATLMNGVDIRDLSTENFYWIPTQYSWDDNTESRADASLEKPYSIIDAIKAGLGFRPSKTGSICTSLIDDVLKLPRDLDRPCDVVKYFTDKNHHVIEVTV